MPNVIERAFNASSINRPYIRRWWHGRDAWGFVLNWGNRNSDPVWSFGIFHEPRRKVRPVAMTLTRVEEGEAGLRIVGQVLVDERLIARGIMSEGDSALGLSNVERTAYGHPAWRDSNAQG